MNVCAANLSFRPAIAATHPSHATGRFSSAHNYEFAKSAASKVSECNHRESPCLWAILAQAGHKLNPKIAFYDIETAPTRGYVWTNYEANLIGTDKDWYILSFAVKWSHEKTVRTYALPDYPSYKRDRECDKALVKDLWKMMNEADIIIAHNGDAFDIKKSNARFIVHGLTPPSTYKTVDTLKIARRHFKFGSNRLNDLGVTLGLGKKLPHTGAHLWFGCMAGDPKSWKTMRRYNAQDVRLLERVYYRIRPWATNHPNLNLYHEGDGCPTCESDNVSRRGFHIKLSTRRQRFQCQDCGAWFSGEVE